MKTGDKTLPAATYRMLLRHGLKFCPMCHTVKPRVEFGRQTRCKPCRVRIVRESLATRKLDPQGRILYRIRSIKKNIGRKRKAGPLYSRNAHKQEARKLLTAQIEQGRIVRPTLCQECGITCKTHAHHPDYSKPFDVQWLCRPCHILKHHPNAVTVRDFGF